VQGGPLNGGVNAEGEPVINANPEEDFATENTKIAKVLAHCHQAHCHQADSH